VSILFRVTFSLDVKVMTSGYCSLLFLPRGAMQARPMPSCCVFPSVCLSVTIVNSVKTNNRILTLFFTVFSQTILVFCIPNLIAIFRRYPINGGVECRWGRKKSRFWTNSWLSINDWWSANNKCDGDHAVYRTDGDASVNLCLSQPAWTTTTKKRKHNRIYLYAAVNLKCK